MAVKKHKIQPKKVKNSQAPSLVSIDHFFKSSSSSSSSPSSSQETNTNNGMPHLNFIQGGNSPQISSFLTNALDSPPKSNSKGAVKKNQLKVVVQDLRQKK